MYGTLWDLMKRYRPPDLLPKVNQGTETNVRGVPGRLLQQEFHVHYVSSSPHASSAEQFAAFRDHAKSTETKPVKAYNAATKRKCRFILRVPGLPADNPQQSEEASHMGKEIRVNLQKQLQLAMRGDPKGVEKLQRATGTKDKIAQYWIELLVRKFQELKAEGPRRTVDQIASEVLKWFSEQPGDKMNPLLDIAGLDPSQDTPLELLHTILLGVIKYVWHHMNTEQWSDTDRHLLAIRLQSTDISGLTVPPIRAAYMMQYKNNLIGKHFKTVMQTLLFHIHEISTPEQFQLVKAAGELGARLWVPEIDDMREYLAQVEITVANLLDAFHAVDPLRILTKIKLHLLAHIMDDVRRFGPLIRSSTEIYEAFNGVFRLCSVYSNHLAPSRDISRKFASMDRVKHLLSGGYWWDSRLQQWVQAGEAVLAILQSDRVVQRHLGWVSPTVVSPGTVEPKPLRKNPAVQWQESAASNHWNISNGTPPQPQSPWRFGRTLFAQSGDKIAIKNWVAAKDLQGRTVFGRIYELLTAEKTAFVTLEQFMCSQQAHRDFCWPVLRRPNGQEIVEGVRSFLVLPSTRVQFIMSVQHDCRMGHCQPAVVRKERQEREETNRDKSLIKHTDDGVPFTISPSSVACCRRIPQDGCAKGQGGKGCASQADSGQTSPKHRREAEEADQAAREAEEAAAAGRDLEGEEDGGVASDREQEDVAGPESEDEPEEGVAMDVEELQPVRAQRARKRKRRRTDL
ncbi:hypothetical protein B0H10DRAFT_1956459 [Mycena sp. CBHHK59/15]|nr:hypothetical protein B0H10DRAFT_1956459 [Mycena sp. CBHHK59/15]